MFPPFGPLAQEWGSGSRRWGLVHHPNIGQIQDNQSCPVRVLSVIEGVVNQYFGNEHPTTETIISKMTDVPVIGRIEEEPYFDENVVKEYANRFKSALKKL